MCIYICIYVYVYIVTKVRRGLSLRVDGFGLGCWLRNEKHNLVMHCFLGCLLEF